MFVALGDLEKLFAFRASTKEMHDRKCSGYFFAVQQRRGTYFSIQGFTGVDNYPASRIAPQFFLSHSGSGSSQKVVIGVYRFRVAIASIEPGRVNERVFACIRSRRSGYTGMSLPNMPVHARHRAFVHVPSRALCCLARRRAEPSRGAYGAACLQHASHGGALSPLRTGTRPNASRTPHTEAR